MEMRILEVRDLLVSSIGSPEKSRKKSQNNNKTPKNGKITKFEKHSCTASNFELKSV